MIPKYPHRVIIGVEPPGTFPVTPPMPHHIPHTPMLPDAPKKALAFQSRIPVAVPRHKATNDANVLGAVLITPVKEEVSACIPMSLLPLTRPYLLSVASLSSPLSRGPRTASTTSVLCMSPHPRLMSSHAPLSGPIPQKTPFPPSHTSQPSPTSARVTSIPPSSPPLSFL